MAQIDLEKENQRLKEIVEAQGKDLIVMQERIAWLESSMETQNKYLQEVFLKFDALEKQIKYLYQKNSQESAVRPLSEETPPPHY